MNARSRGVVSVGYEGKTLEVLLAELGACGTHVLVDVRMNAVSRKRGFSKRGLAVALSDVGIEYAHLPMLGNPRWNRAGFSGATEDVVVARARYASMLANDAAASRIREIAEIATDRVVALMCFEADELACHRYVILKELQRELVQGSSFSVAGRTPPES